MPLQHPSLFHPYRAELGGPASIGDVEIIVASAASLKKTGGEPFWSDGVVGHKAILSLKARGQYDMMGWENAFCLSKNHLEEEPEPSPLARVFAADDKVDVVALQAIPGYNVSLA